MDYYAVLIETSWNVKKEDIETLHMLCRSINRNIVECKGICEKTG